LEPHAVLELEDDKLTLPGAPRPLLRRKGRESAAMADLASPRR